MAGRILRYAAPLLGRHYVLLSAGVAAIAVLGRTGSARGLACAAVGIALGILCAGICGAFAAGAMVNAAHARSTGDNAGARRIAAEGMGLALLLGIALGAAIVALDARILFAMNVPFPLLVDARQFTGAVALSLPFTFAFAMFAALREGAGDAATPARMIVAACAVFIAAIAAFVPHFGATVVPLSAAAVAGLVTFVAMLRTKSLRFSLPSIATSRAMLACDTPVAIQTLAVALAELTLLAIVNRYGEHAAAAYVIVTMLVPVVMLPVCAFATAASVFPNALRACLGWSLAITVSLTALFYVFAPPIARIFTNDPQTAGIAHDALFAMLWSVPVLGIGGIVAGVLDAWGDGFWAAAISITGIWLILIPCAYAFTAHSGVLGVWEAFPAAYAPIAFAQVLCAMICDKRRRIAVEAPTAT